MRRMFLILLFLLFCCSGQAQRIGVSLSGGGALGYAHLGFLQAMDEAGIRPDVVCGTSMGAIMGMMYCAGYAPRQILDMVHKEKMDRLATLVRPTWGFSGGFISTEPTQKVLLRYVPHNSFDSLKIRFYCCLSDINNMRPLYCGHGTGLVQRVMASAAVPGVFEPMEIDGIYCVDGSIFDQLPEQPLSVESCEVKLASLIIVEKPRQKINPHHVWIHAYSAAAFSSTKVTRDKFNYVVEIDPGNYWMLDFSKVDELFDIGYRAGKAFFSAHRFAE